MKHCTDERRGQKLLKRFQRHEVYQKVRERALTAESQLKQLRDELGQKNLEINKLKMQLEEATKPEEQA